ncbi:MAG: transpeptidase family protein [Vicinamibacteria bacterium]|jgi:cell division protein FtsI (penicillin-binding protein 3)|nr:transpeptidase family protein [Vicinamibacteria bacterium]
MRLGDSDLNGMPGLALGTAPLQSEGPASPGGHMGRLRLMLLALSAALCALIITGRLLQLQFLEHRAYEVKAARQSERTINLDPRRGPIVDRRGRSLAVSVEAESLYADPQNIDDPVAAVQGLTRALGLNAQERKDTLAQLRRDKAFVWIKRKVDPNQAQAVRALELSGLGFLTESRRYYPNRELAAQVLGYVGVDNAGMWGVEYAFDPILRGRAAKVVIRTDARRRPVGHQERPSTDGQTLALTIDLAVQHIAERELERSMAETAALSGMVVVADPLSGEILAMANRPAFNPNRYWMADSSCWRNRAVADAFEPGSIFKVITAAAGISEKVVTPDEIIDCGHGAVEIAGQVINDHAVFDQLTFRDVIAKSSDVGVIRVAQRLGRENFERYVRNFGFGAATGVDLPGESPGLLRDRSKWSAMSLASMSFGQEIGVTALQVVMAMGAVAADGYLMKPLIVQHIEDRDGRLVKSYKPIAMRRILDPAVVDVLRELLKGVVRHGTGRLAAVPGYEVAGKTGTAQKIEPQTGRYSMTDHVASFVGYVPASRPAFVILASLDSPRGARNQGGDVAAPLFARVAEAALRLHAVSPDDPARTLRVVNEPALPTTPAALRASELPPALLVDNGLMPDLRGRSAREAALWAARLGLIVKLTGSGEVVAQVPLPGTEIEPGTTCRLTLMPQGAQRTPEASVGVGS